MKIIKEAFIINPFSVSNHNDFLNKLLKKRPDALFMVSKSKEDTNVFIEKYFEEVDIFIAVGGDGTVSTIANKLINTDKILGIFPAGSGNGFAKETNFINDLDNLINKIKCKKFQEIDVISVNRNISINVSGVGLDGEIIKRFENTNRGFFNYIKTSIKTFFKFKPIYVEFEDKYKRYNGSYLMINLANTRQFGNNAYIAPHADYRDGMIDIVLLKKFPLWFAPYLVYGMFTKKLKNNKYLSYFSISNLKFSVKNYQTWHLDGEGIEIPSPIEVKAIPKSLRVLL